MNPGGKAAGLNRLGAVGPVPPFLVVPGEVLVGHPTSVQASVRRLVEQAGIRPPYAVRSSAMDEDGRQHSFAGMYETRLGVSEAELFDAITAVADSGGSGRVRAYRAARGIQGNDSLVRVIVQEMVAAETAGVVFSRDPATPECARVEVVRGLGEDLVSGIAVPETHLVDRGTLVTTFYSPGRQYSYATLDGLRHRMAGREVSARRLTAEQVHTVISCALTAESVFTEATAGVDLEWAFARGSIRLLQCRPITVGAASQPRSEGNHA